MAGPALPARRALGRRGRQLRGLVHDRDRRSRCACSTRTGATRPASRWTRAPTTSGTATCPGSGPGSATASASTARTTRPAACSTTRRSCWSIPYARAIEGDFVDNPAVYADSPADSAPFVPRSVVVHDAFPWGDDHRPAVPWDDTVIYELHVRGFTMRHPDIPPELRGTYAGLAHPAAIEYLRSLGVTAVELLPIHHFVSEPQLQHRGLAQLLGLQLDRLLRAARGVRLAPRQPGPRVQGDGAGAARGRHRGHPRRRLQPHRRGRAGRPDAVPSAASTTGPTTAWTPTTCPATSTTPAAATPSTRAGRSRCS